MTQPKTPAGSLVLETFRRVYHEVNTIEPSATPNAKLKATIEVMKLVFAIQSRSAE